MGKITVLIIVFVFAGCVTLLSANKKPETCADFCDKYEYEEEYVSCLAGCDWANDNLTKTSKENISAKKSNDDSSGNKSNKETTTKTFEIKSTFKYIPEDQDDVETSIEKGGVVQVKEVIFSIEPGCDIFTDIGSKIFYILKNDKNSTGYLRSYAVCPGTSVTLNKYIKIGGQTSKIKYSSNNSGLKINEDGSFIAITPGNYSINITVNNQTEHLMLQVIEIPAKANADKEEVINILGLPGRENIEYISWPDSKYVDGIFYTNTNDGHGISVDHWFYNEYPEAILSFTIVGKLESVKTAAWDKFYHMWYKNIH